MDFNARGSYQQQQQQQQQQRANGNKAGGQGKQKKDDGDEFMRLSDHEIVGCINDIKIPFTQDDLLRPQPAQIQRVFECFALLLMNCTRETVEPAMREAARDICGEGLADLVPPETRNMMGFYASLRKLLEACGVHDFSFSDLTRPTHPRLVKIFSYIINFVRFRESQSETMDKYFRLFEDTQSRIETVYTENQDLTARLSHLRTNQASLQAQAKAKTTRIDELKSKLFTLKKEQERLQTDMDRTRAQKGELAKSLQDRVDRTQQQRQEAEKLRPYALQSTPALQAQLSELADALTRDKSQAENLEKRARALQTSADTFSLATNDVQPLIALLRSAAQDLGAEEAETLDAQRRRDALTERSNNVREVERTESMLQRQLARWVERTEAVRVQAKERADAARERMEALKEEHRKLAAERGESGREVERRRVRIEQTEKKMTDLKDTIEQEINAARDEYAKLDAHVRLYVTEMEGMIAGHH